MQRAISIFGLGYVGCVGMGCLARMGHKIVGVDVSDNKVGLIKKGIPTIVEKDIDNLIKEGFEAGRIDATRDYVVAVKETEISFICVPTPNNATGHLDLSFVEKVSEEIAIGLSEKTSFHTVVIRSTVLPGTNERVASIIQTRSGKIAGQDFCVVSNPEFLREGNAVDDFFNPSITVIGSDCEKGVFALKDLYSPLPGEKKVVSIRVAESIKMLNNSFHALKVAFANEVGSICKALGIDAFELMDVFLADTKLNISPAYLKPGFAYGGSCLPKDLKALNLLAYDSYLKNPILSSVEPSNKWQIEKVIELIERTQYRNIAVWGISFKDGTDDLRNSPIVEVIERLLGKGYMIRIFDKNVNVSLLIGANKQYIDSKLPHFSELLVNDPSDLVSNPGLLIINTKLDDSEQEMVLENIGLSILDLRHVPGLKSHPNYNGINW